MENFTSNSQIRESPPDGSQNSGEEWLIRPLFAFSTGEKWTVRDAVEGTQIFGATGSGKSSGSGRELATSFIRAGLGGVVLAAKSDELEQWLTYFRQAEVEDPIGEDRLRVLSPETSGDHYFDPLAYEYGLAPEGGTRRLTNLFMTALGSGDGRVSSDPFWDDALRELLGHAIDLVAFGKASESEGQLVPSDAPPSLAEIANVVRTSAVSIDEARSTRWLSSGDACPSLLGELDSLHKRLQGNSENEPILADMADTFGYWTRVLPSLAERTRSVVLSSFTGKANDLLRRPLRQLFCSGNSRTVDPSATHNGKVVLINLPVKRFGDVGEFAQKLYKTVWQHATESDQRSKPMRPTFLWADEAQHFVTKEDVLFQATARSKLAATVYLTQNVSNYHCVLGGAQSSSTDALLGSLQMKVFHSNGDPATNELGERLFGQKIKKRNPRNRGINTGKEASVAAGRTEQFDETAVVPAREFTRLERGGEESCQTEAFVFHPGKKWNNGSGGTKVVFSQNGKPPAGNDPEVEI